MEDYLYCKDLYEPIEGDSTKPEDKLEREWQVMHRNAIGLIKQWIDNSIFHHFVTETNANLLWKK